MMRIGTRGSALALWQAREVQAGLREASEIVIVATSGDRDRRTALQGRSEVGFFTREIEEKLLAGEIDLAVHSLKDLPTGLDPRLELAATLPRAEVSDLLLVHPDWYSEEGLLPLRPGCVVGAGSLRRQAMVRAYAPSAVPSLIRGNVTTRVRKCLEGNYGAIVLARAGIERLEADTGPLLVFELNPEVWLCAPGQGAVAVEVRAGDECSRNAARVLNDPPTFAAVTLERKLLANFEGGCHTAFAAHASPGSGAMGGLSEKCPAPHPGQRQDKGGDAPGLSSLPASQPSSLQPPASGLWQVSVGMDRGADGGWGQKVYRGSYKELGGFGPERLPEFELVSVGERSAICRRWS